jgi:hypothetical protein
MSKCCYQQPMCYPRGGYGMTPGMGYGMTGGTTAFAGGGFNFTTLVALILIILVFGNCYGKGSCGSGKGWGSNLCNQGILFIIAFFFLACGCGGGKGWGVGGY